jgi:hypothetical protein
MIHEAQGREIMYPHSPQAYDMISGSVGLSTGDLEPTYHNAQDFKRFGVKGKV